MITGPESKSSDFQFPEDQYKPVRRAITKDYEARVQVGYANMRRSSAVVCALGRNIEPVLPRTIQQVTQLLDCFRASAFVILENDSQDDTARWLSEWARQESRVKYLSRVYGDPVHPNSRSLPRAARMAFYRNIVKEYAQFNHKSDYVIVLDTDLPVGFSQDGIANTFSWPAWDMVGSNGIRRQTMDGDIDFPQQYDAWAFRPNGDWTPRTAKEVNRMQFFRGEDLVPVHSCFGGLAIYTMPAYKAGEYNGADCEHVSLHRALRYNGHPRQYLNPSMICDYGRK